MVASTVGFDDGSTRLEFDAYAGVAVLMGTTECYAELTCASCDEDVPGPTCLFWQAKLLARRYCGDPWLAACMTHTPQSAYAGGRQTKYLRGGCGEALESVEPCAGLGRHWPQRGRT